MVNLNLSGTDAFTMPESNDHLDDLRGGGNDMSAAKAKYTMPGVLHYLQHEWSRFEMERAQFDMERAELQARISFLQGEKKGQENLKMDLVRRIKMLELALRQERMRSYRATHPDGDIEETEADTDDTDGIINQVPSDVDAVSQPHSNVSWRQGRHLLRQYLNEIGYSETILDVRSHRVKSLLGLQHNVDAANSDSGDSVGHPPPRHIAQNVITDATNAVNSLDFLRAHNSTAESDDDEPEETKEEMGAAEEAAMHDFDFLSPADKAGGKKTAGDWGMNEQSIQKLNEYKEGAKRMMKEKHDSIVKASEEASDSGEEPYLPPLSKGAKEIEQMLELDDGNAAKQDDIRVQYDEEDAKELPRKWNLRYTLRNHLDSVRCLQFHPVEPLLCTASEDGTVKLWNLGAATPDDARNTINDLEPVYTCRAHVGPVLSLVLSNTGDMAYTGGHDGTVRCWMLPSPATTSIYDKYDPRTLVQTLTGHKDAVFSVAVHASDNRLISASADGTLKLWEPGNHTTPLIKTFAPPTPNAVPVAVDFVSTETDQVLVAYNPGTALILDLETGKTVVSFDCSNGGKVCAIIKCAIHIPAVLFHAIVVVA